MTEEQWRRKQAKTFARMSMEIYLLQKTVVFLAFELLPRSTVDDFFERMDLPPEKLGSEFPEFAEALEDARTSFFRSLAKYRTGSE